MSTLARKNVLEPYPNKEGTSRNGDRHTFVASRREIDCSLTPIGLKHTSVRTCTLRDCENVFLNLTERLQPAHVRIEKLTRDCQHAQRQKLCVLHDVMD